MAAYYITSEQASKAISLTVLAKKMRRESKAAIVKRVREYGEYLGAWQCDIQLVIDTVLEVKKAELYDEMEALAVWFRTMDRIAQGD